MIIDPYHNLKWRFSLTDTELWHVWVITSHHCCSYDYSPCNDSLGFFSTGNTCNLWIDAAYIQCVGDGLYVCFLQSIDVFWYSSSNISFISYMIDTYICIYIFTYINIYVYIICQSTNIWHHRHHDKRRSLLSNTSGGDIYSQNIVNLQRKC